MKKIVSLILTVCVLGLALAGCGNQQAADAGSGPITVVSREDGSGTRGAFIELTGVEEKDASGNNVDNTVDTAEIANSTSVVMTTVAGDPAAIGYISLGSLNDTVKALTVDGVVPSVETVKDGSYTIARPFNVATKGNLSPIAQDFMAFIMSKNGQDVVANSGFIPVDDTGAFTGNKPAGKLVVAGSTSVAPVMEKLKEAYVAINPNAQIEIQSTGSSAGMTAAIEGLCDIGMASRELKDSELAAGLTPTVIAMDGIVMIVHLENTIENLTKDQVKEIYTGTLADWSELK